MPPQAAPMTGTASPTRHWGSEDVGGQEFSTGSQHVHFAPVPILYVPGIYPVYSEFPQLSHHDSEQGTTFHNEEDANEPSASTDDHTTEASAESAGLEGRGTGLRHPRYSRRVQSKSEPSSSGTTSEETS